MQAIKVKKKDLIKILKQNRDKHLKDYQLAVVGYKITLKTKLQDKIKELENLPADQLNNFEYSINLVQPVSYLSEYDVTLGMLEITNDKEISITPTEYRQYYLDEWSWKSQWYYSNAGNIGLGTSVADHKLILS